MYNCIFFVSVDKSEYVFFDCSRDTDADEEHGVAHCILWIWSTVLCHIKLSSSILLHCVLDVNGLDVIHGWLKHVVHVILLMF